MQAALPVAQTATTALAVLCGLLLLPFTVPPSMRWVGGARLRGDRRPTIMAAVLFVVYLVIVSSAGGRHLFAMQPIGVLQQILLIVIAVSWGFTVRAIWHWRVLDRLFGPPEGRPLTQAHRQAAVAAAAASQRRCAGGRAAASLTGAPARRCGKIRPRQTRGPESPHAHPIGFDTSGGGDGGRRPARPRRRTPPPHPARDGPTRRRPRPPPRRPSRPTPARLAAVDLGDRPSLYINRELSMLAFQRRVLEEAQDERNPLLERVKFLSILGSNLGEFFMVRVAGLRQQVEAGVADLSADGMTPAEQLVACRELAYELMREARETWATVILPQLTAAGVAIHDYAELDEGQREAAVAYFDRSAFPVLTPLAFDPGRPFPHISNMSLNLAVLLRDESGQQLFARVKVPSSLPRLVTAAGAGRPAGRPPRRGATTSSGSSSSSPPTWTSSSPAWRSSASTPSGSRATPRCPSRSSRPTTCSRPSSRACCAAASARSCASRSSTATPDDVRDILLDNLDLEPEGLIAVAPPLGMSGINLLGLDRPDLKDPPFVPAVPRGLGDPDLSVFAAIRKHDILIHRPYDSFEPVIDWLESAAHDPDVLAIKMTLYRVGRNAPAVAALLEAARNGKEVAVLVELKARFDEEPNIEWARALEDEGVHVVYGLVGLKTHSKIAHGRAPRGRRHPALRAPRHRQLQRRHGAPLHRPRPVHLRPGHRPGRDRALQLPDRLLALARLQEAAGRPDQPARALRGPARARDRAPEGRPRRPPHLQDELADRPQDDRHPLPGLAGRREDRPAGARHVLAAPRRSRRERQHPA